ncbi:MAG TPA: VOC family protein [Mycobacterium sp.]|uniref:VOC family protein n=1 Tax=Mycobacterium sp. TaxID=1785 RepID=UPI002D270E1F|nr:VOC family protein [Mycobacterium sp.]HXY64621.1 VOC family protein [Mycobacterium sp.]
MTQHPIGIIGFSHICIAVSDAEASLRFYRDLLGLNVFFDVELDGPPMEVVTGETGARGRMIGGMLGGTVVELLEFAHRQLDRQSETVLGYTNISLSVRDLDAALAAVTAAGYEPEQQPVEIGGVRMFFVRDPDGTPVEFVSYPGGEKTSAQMWGHTS